MTKLQENLEVSKLQERVDSLQVITDAGIKYNSNNRDMLIYDLKRAKEKLADFKKNIVE